VFIRGRFVRLGRLHELDGSPIWVANVNDSLSRVRAGFKSLRFAGGFPTGRGDRGQHRVEIIYEERNVHRADVARPKIDMFSVRRCEVFEQFNLVPITFENGERDLGPRHAGDFAGQIAGVMSPMRKLEAQNITPESHGELQIGDRDAGVIGRDYAKGPDAHTRVTQRVSPQMDTDQRQIGKLIFPFIGENLCQSVAVFTAAITLSSIAMGVGSAVTSIVVRVGFGLPGPAKYSA